MNVDCVNCGGPDAEQTSITIDSERTITDLRLCEECLDAFQTTEWIHIEESPTVG